MPASLAASTCQRKDMPEILIKFLRFNPPRSDDTLHVAGRTRDLAQIGTHVCALSHQAQGHLRSMHCRSPAVEAVASVDKEPGHSRRTHDGVRVGSDGARAMPASGVLPIAELADVGQHELDHCRELLEPPGSWRGVKAHGRDFAIAGETQRVAHPCHVQVERADDNPPLDALAGEVWRHRCSQAVAAQGLDGKVHACTREVYAM